MKKKHMNPNLIHCCVCGKTLSEKCPPGETVNNMPFMCPECGAKMMVAVDASGYRTVKEIAGPRHG